MKHAKMIQRLWLLAAIVLLSGCYDKATNTDHDALVKNENVLFDSVAYHRMQDSLTFYSKHHYTDNYNFVVKAESIALSRQMPEEVVSNMPTDSFAVNRHDHLVVANIRIIPTDPVDTVWVEVARDQLTFGWIHESELLPNVVPDDPISQFISTFSDTHLLLFLIVVSIIAAAYLLRVSFRRNARIVHFNDINSLYPTLLALNVATAAAIYATIQHFDPEMWRHFYYHPTLNPFAVPGLLSAFLFSVWLLFIVGLACIDVVMQRLPLGDAVLYLGGLAAVCAVNYIVFSLTTLYYIGYVLLAAYFWFALRAYRRHSHCRYACGNCGAPLHQKGVCPSCGAVNE